MKRHPKPIQYRVRFVYDDDAEFEECNGESRPLTETEYAENSYNRKNGTTMPYDEYLAYYGNPERHVYFGVVVDAQCPCCLQWTANAASLWRIDMMDDDPELQTIVPDVQGERHSYTPDRIAGMKGYLADTARELLAEARKTQESIK